jgi:hypothetical protein
MLNNACSEGFKTFWYILRAGVPDNGMKLNNNGPKSRFM